MATDRRGAGSSSSGSPRRPISTSSAEETHPAAVEPATWPKGGRGSAWSSRRVWPRHRTGWNARRGGRPRVQVVADGTDANSSGVALGYVQGLVGEFNAGAGRARRDGSTAAIEGRVRVWFNPDLESRNFMVPGVLAMLLLLIVTSNLTSMAIVREQELGTLDQLNVTPLGRWELIIGKLVPYGARGVRRRAARRGRRGVLVRGAAARECAAAASARVAIYLLCTLGLGLVRVDHFVDAAAGDDDGDVLLSHPDALSVGLHLPDREHAAASSSG